MKKKIKVIMRQSRDRGENVRWYRIEQLVNTAEIADHKGMIHYVGSSVCHDTSQQIAVNPHYEVTILMEAR